MSFIHLKNRDPEEIVAQALDMNDLQREIYFGLRDQELTVKDLVDKTGRTRSVVQRALQELLDKGIIVREGRTDRTVYYVYTSVPFEKVKKQVSNIIARWYREINEKLS